MAILPSTAQLITDFRFDFENGKHCTPKSPAPTLLRRFSSRAPAFQNVYRAGHSEPDFLDQSNHSLAVAGERPFFDHWTQAQENKRRARFCPSAHAVQTIWLTVPQLPRNIPASVNSIPTLGQAFVRSMGRWTMTFLVINCIIGGGIFGLPGELTRLLGRASPFAMIFAALGMALILACFAEVASQFSEPGGAYLYVRTAFGGFAGMQIGWFDLLNVVGTVAALANLFVDYLAPFFPGTLNSWNRALVMAILIAVPAAANYRGVRSGANLSSLMTLAKLLPLALLVLVGVTHFSRQPQLIQLSEITSDSLIPWRRRANFRLCLRGSIRAFTHPQPPSCCMRSLRGCLRRAVLSSGW
jgi:hypothetical protein